MQDDNRVLQRTYFIGGAPRVGKSLLSLALAKNISGHIVSTDSIVSAAKKACTDKTSDLFILNTTEPVSDHEWMRAHRDEPQLTIDHQNRQSIAAWPSITAFCNSFVEDDLNHVVEGVHLLPSLIAKLEHRPDHVFFVGNTNPEHATNMLHHAQTYPEKDWMAAVGYSEEKIRAMAVFVVAMSRYFKSEAERLGFEYYELGDRPFDESIVWVLDRVLKR